jgi:hypothetical protein
MQTPARAQSKLDSSYDSILFAKVTARQLISERVTAIKT